MQIVSEPGAVAMGSVTQRWLMVRSLPLAVLTRNSASNGALLIYSTGGSINISLLTERFLLTLRAEMLT